MKVLYTIGHSNHSLKDFLELISFYEIDQLVDIRTIPKSRHVPWFNKKKLTSELSKRKIAYQHIAELGGLRNTTKNSINQAWNNASFRGYADYMQTPEFFTGLKTLNQYIKKSCKTAIMCAEALPWRCHRTLVADAEVIRNIKVIHIMSKTSAHEHKLTSFAKIDKTKRPIQIYYPKKSGIACGNKLNNIY